jgi:hypothetical protein
LHIFTLLIAGALEVRNRGLEKQCNNIAREGLDNAALAPQRRRALGSTREPRRIDDAGGSSLAAYRAQSRPRSDPAGGGASRGARLRRCLDKRAHHHSEGCAISAFCGLLRPGFDPDLGGGLHQEDRARHQRAGLADAAPAAARQGIGDITEPVRGTADPRGRGRLDGGRIRCPRRAVPRAWAAHG